MGFTRRGGVGIVVVVLVGLVDEGLLSVAGMVGYRIRVSIFGHFQMSQLTEVSSGFDTAGSLS